MQETVARIVLEVDPAVEPAVEAFLDREWAAWHAEAGHDGSEDWSRSIVRVIAYDEGQEVIGAAAGRTRAGVGHLSDLMVDRRFRGHGLGTELLARFEAHCAATGCHKLTVHTDAEGPAHRFYLGRGWKAEAVFRRDRGGRDFVRLCKFIEDYDDNQ